MSDTISRSAGKEGRNVYRSVQYLRAAASLMVVLHHSLAPADGLSFPWAKMDFLASGVDIFFVISGFIIYTSQSGRSDRARPFLRRRFIRVVPLYWLATLALIILHKTAGVARDLSLQPWHVVASFLLLPHYSPSAPTHLWPLLIPGWSLMYEAFFYAAYAAAIALAPGREAKALVATLLGLVLVGMVWAPVSAAGVVYTNPLLLEFVGGMGIAALVQRVPLPPALVLLVPVGFIALALADLNTVPRIVAWGGPAVLIVLGLVAAEPRIGASRLLAIGDGSYSIYLTHVMTLSLVRGVWRHVPGHDRMPAAIAFVAIALIASIVVGMIVHLIVEKKLLSLSRSRPAKPPAVAVDDGNPAASGH